MPQNVLTPLTTATLRSTRAIQPFPDWRPAAACRDLPASSVFSTCPAEAAIVLRACNVCPVRAECEAVVDPAHTWFDGVSGGRLWRNGREVPLARTHDDAPAATQE